MLVGASHFIQQMFQAFFLINCSNLSELVRTGKFDFLLLLPVNTRFVVSLRQLDLGAFVNAASSLAVMFYAGRQLHLTPTVGQVLGFLALCVAGILIHYSLMFLLATISFWTVRAQGIVWGYYNLFNIARMPDDAFPRGVFKTVFTFALPVLLVSNVPARLLTDRLTSSSCFLLVGMAIACAFFSEPETLVRNQSGKFLFSENPTPTLRRKYFLAAWSNDREIGIVPVFSSCSVHRFPNSSRIIVWVQIGVILLCSPWQQIHYKCF